MRWWMWGLVGGLIGATGAGSQPFAPLLTNGDFETGDFTGWDRAILGDQQGVIEIATLAHRGQFAARLHAPTNRSWTFLRQVNLPLPRGTAVTLSAWVKTTSSAAKIVLSDGFVWGGDPAGHQTASTHHSGSGEWERLRCTLTVSESPVTVALGFDYGAKGAEMWVDEVTLQADGETLLEDLSAWLERYRRLLKERDLPPTLREEVEQRLTEGEELVRATRERAQNLANREAQERAEAWAQLAQPVQEFLQRQTALVLWAGNPLENFPPTLKPPHWESISELSWAGAGNEYESAVLRITNLFGQRPADLRVTVSTLQAPGGEGVIPAAALTLRRAVFVRLRSGALRPDALPRLDEADLVTVPPGETGEVWITVHLAGVEPGEYTGTLSLCPLDPQGMGGPQTVTLRLTVWPFTLPDPLPLTVFDWDYSLAGQKGPLRERYLEDLLAHHVNAFHVTRLPTPAEDGTPPDFSSLDDLLLLLKGKGLLLLEFWFMREAGWQDAYAEWVQGLIAHLRELGFTYDQYLLYPFDEYLGPKFVEVARQIKALDPQVQIFSNRIGPLEEVEAIAPYVDVWCPHADHLAQYPDSLAFMRETGKPIWTYLCGSGKYIAPETNRALPWRAWQYGLDGCTFWTYKGWVGDPWNDFDGSRPDWNKIYPGSEGPISSRRWEAWRDGLEDWAYLYLLRQALERARAAGRAGEVVERAEGVLTEAVKGVLQGQGAERFFRWRQALAEVLIKLEG